MTTMTLVPSGLPTIHDATLPVSYERAKAALATCVEIDECKDWADKAAALASYAKQAEDQTLHHFATRISARAIKRAGELLEQFDARGAHRKNGSAPVSSRIDAGKRAGMSPDQITQAVRVANVPVDEFEALVESEHPPTVTALAELGTAKQAERPVVPGVREATHIIAFWAASRPGGQIPGERDVLQQRCEHCHAFLDHPLNDGELDVVAMAEDGTLIYQLVTPS